MDIAESILDLIGNTPMVKLPRLSESQGLTATLAVKLETTNPGGSVEGPAGGRDDRRRRARRPAAAGRHDRRADLGQHRSRPRHRRRATRLPVRVRDDRQGGAGEDRVPARVRRRSRRVPGRGRAGGSAVVLLDGRASRSRDPRCVPTEPVRQPRNPQAHDDTTGPEIWRQTAGRSHPLRRRASAPAARSPASVGTSSRRTRACRSSAPTPRARSTRADRVARTWSRASARTSGPRPTTRRSSTASIAVSDEDSFLMARRVTREEGLLIGGSGGTAVAAALEVGRELGPDDLVVVLIPDSGRGYLSRVFNDDWMAGFGFLRTSRPLRRRRARGARRRGARRSSTCTPTTRCARPSRTMRKHGVSQLPGGQGRAAARRGRGVGRGRRARAHGRRLPRPGACSTARSRRSWARGCRPSASASRVELAVELLDQAPAVARAVGRPSGRGAHPHRRARRSSPSRPARE